MRTAIVACVAVIALAACDQQNHATGTSPEPAPVAAEPAASAPVASGPEDVIVADAKIPEPVASDADLIAGLMAGGSATLHLDCQATPETTAQLGTIMCGKDYVVYYEQATARWVAIGPNSVLAANGAANPIAGAKIPGPPPSERTVVVWGAAFSIAPDYRASLGGGAPLGKLVHTKK